MSDDARVAVPSAPSWQSKMLHALVRARMRRNVPEDIDPLWVRRQLGRPRAPRRWMARSTGATATLLSPRHDWPGGEVVTWPGAAPASPVLLYLHGGGYIACSPETHRPLISSLVRRIKGTAYVPEYRLAPEAPYPAALRDAFAAYAYLLNHAGIAPSRIVVAGDSAGGGLALALALYIRDQGVALPAAVVAFSPWTDLAATGRSLDDNTERCAMFSGGTIRAAAHFYVGEADPTNPLVSPLYGDFHGLPPLLVHAGLDEVLRDDAMRVVDRARASGVVVEARFWRHVPHVWQFFAAVMPEAEQSLTDTVRFVLAQTSARAEPRKDSLSSVPK